MATGSSTPMTLDPSLLILAQSITATITGLGILYANLATLAVLRFAEGASERLRGQTTLQPVTVLKPLRGSDPGLDRNLASFAAQDYSAPIQILCGVQDPADPALGTMEQLRQGGLPLEVIVDPRRHGSNRKIDNLINMLPAARHPVLAVADSDMRVPRGYLREIVAPLADPRVGLVTCLYRGVPAGGLWSSLAAAGVNHFFLPSVLVGRLLGVAPGCFGSTMAIRRETLDRVGGFDAFADRLADDHALGHAVRALGLEVVISSIVIDHVMDEASLGTLWGHELRWARTIRLLSPWGHAGTAVTHAIPWAFACAMLCPTAAASWGLLVLALLARLGLADAVERAFAMPPSGWPLVLVRELLSFAVFVMSFGGRGVVWRGRRYRVGRDGVMVEL